MIRSDLIRRLAEKRKLDRTKAQLIVTTVLDGIESALRCGERFEIRGLGTFSVRSYPGYEGRNPKTGTPVEVNPKEAASLQARQGCHRAHERGCQEDAGAGRSDMATGPS